MNWKRMVWTLPLLVAGSVEAQSGYGSRVAAGEGVLFVAEPGNIARSGIVYAYAARAGKWTEIARIAAPDAATADEFGSAIATSGSTLLASRLKDDNGRGAVFVFERRGDAWQHVARLNVEGAANDSVGAALSVAGDLALVGAPGTASSAGAAYLFRRGADGRWVQESKFVASDAQAGDHFGSAVSVSANRVLIGAPGQAKARGGAYMFLRGANGQWTEEARLVARTVKENDRLGSAVVLAGDKGVASAPGRDENTGAVYIFEKNPNPNGPQTWGAYTRLFPHSGSSQSQFGAALAMVGNELWVGTPGVAGIFRFQFDQATNSFTQSKLLNYREGFGGFASAFAIAGDAAIAGLPGDAFGEGSAVVLTKQADGEWKPEIKLASEPESFERVTGKPVPCSAGKSNAFECGNVELLGFLPLKEIGGKRGIQLNDIWGWTDPQSGKEYALIGRMDGTSFVDVSNASNPVYLGDLPMTAGATANAWRDIKVYKDHAFVVADGAGKHGMQVFDLKKLRDVKNAPVTFTADVIYDRIQSAHNIVINEDKGYAYSVGSNGGGDTCGGALHMIDIREPKKPKFVGCSADPLTGQAKTGYTHDSQCVTYKGPDEKYRGREICFNSSETALGIADVTDKAKPVQLSRASYPNVQYSHQGWLTEDQKYFYMDDEGDEAAGVVPRTRTIIWDVTDLDDPQVMGEFLSPTSAIDHNLYIKGDLMYQSHYTAGLRIVDISDRKNPREIGFFDSVPNSPNNPTFGGSWSNYPYFKSGIIVFTSMREGLFIVKMQKPVS